jgi:menaquinone-dependent protoporphyrinogen oxidase
LKILLIYSTTDGHTIEICERIKKVVENEGAKITLVSIKDVGTIDLHSYDKIIIGASIRYGKHSPLIVDFVNSNIELLNSKPNAFFSVNVVARKPEKNSPETNPYLIKFLKRINWLPKNLAVFAGKIDYPSYTYFDRIMIQFIMWMTKGPTHPSTVIEFTDWKKVEEFGHAILKMN